MQKVIHNLRQRPHHERRAVAAGVALSTTGVLLVGWFVFFVHNLGASDAQTYAAQSATDANTASAEVSQPPPAQQPVATSAAPTNIPAGGWLTSQSTTTIGDYLNSQDSSADQTNSY